MAIPEAGENGSGNAPDSDPQTLPSEDPTTTTTAERSSTSTETPATAPTEPEPTAHNLESESAPASEPPASASPAEKRWPGWPGDCVFRLIVPVLKVGSIIGRRGDLIKKMCEETRARIRVLDGAVGTPDRVVSSRTLFLSRSRVFINSVFGCSENLLIAETIEFFYLFK
jgi:hypothetical protein